MVSDYQLVLLALPGSFLLSLSHLPLDVLPINLHIAMKILQSLLKANQLALGRSGLKRIPTLFRIRVKDDLASHTVCPATRRPQLCIRCRLLYARA